MALRELVLRSPNGWCYRHQLEPAPFAHLERVIPGFTGEVIPDRLGLGPIGVVFEIGGAGRIAIGTPDWAAFWQSSKLSPEIAWARNASDERFMLRMFGVVNNPKRKRGHRGAGRRALPEREALAEAMVLHATGSSQRDAVAEAVDNLEERTGRRLTRVDEARLRKALERELKRVRPMPPMAKSAEP